MGSPIYRRPGIGLTTSPFYYISTGIGRKSCKGLPMQQEKSMIEIQTFEEITQIRMSREIGGAKVLLL